MSTPLYQEALIEAKKLRDAAATEAKNAVLEAVSPLIKQMIDKEISGIILEQEEPATPPTDASADAPPPAPPTPSPDAGSTTPVDAAPPAGAESKPTMPGMTPAVSAASPPIKSPGTDVIGKIDLGPGGEQQIVIPVDALFQKEAMPTATTSTVETPAVTPSAPEGAAATPSPDAGATPPPPESLSEIYRAVQKLLREQAAPTPPPPAAPPADPAAAGAAPPPPAPPADPAAAGAPGGAAPPGATPPPATGAAPPSGDLNAAAGAAPVPGAPPAPGAAPPPAGATPPPADASAPPPPAAPPAPDATGAAAPPVTPAPNAAGAPAPAPVTEYKIFKQNLDRTEELVQSLRSKQTNGNALFLKEAYEKQLFSLYNNLLGLRSKNAISPRLFSFNEDRLGLLYENLNVITSYKQNPLVKGKNNMANKNSLKDLVRSLFEGAEGFEDAVGKVDPAGDSEGGDAEHAHRVSGNPKGHKASAEAAPFSTKQKKEWPGKPSPESLLEQLEEEIGELMAEMEGHEEGMDEGMDEEDEVVLELSDEEVMMEARKARSRIKALREQAEDKLSLTIDLDGVSGSAVSNVNVSLDGEELEVDMEEEEGMEEEGEDSAEEEKEEAEEALKESRRVVRKAVNENKALRGHLHETQLLTARSLFVNKLFVRDELTGAQKRKIVEYLDSANTIAEAKEIYNRLVRVLDAGKKNGAMIKESAQRPAVRYITETVSVEPSFDTSRWQILAGVKRNAK